MLTSGSVEDARTNAAPADIAALAGVQYLYVEGGAKTAAAFLAEGLVDRIELYRAQIDSGGERDALASLGLEAWRRDESRQLGSDTFTAYERAPCSPA